MEEPREPLPVPQTATDSSIVSERESRSFFYEIRGWIRDIFFAALTAVVIVVFVVQPVKVEGTSMLPQLVDQERIFVNKFVYHFSTISRGEIVVFWYPRDTTKSFIKRVIGVPGDTVEVRGGSVYINGERLEESYVSPEFLDLTSYSRVTVPADHYYVLGDHRNSSNDSRNWGLVPARNIFGKAVFRYWPVSRLGTLD